MLSLALTFLMLAISIAVLGFAGVSALAVNIAQNLSPVFFIGFVVALVIHLAGGGSRRASDRERDLTA